ncbi:hypothetical protein KUF83_28160 [Streptomyces sp. BV286]|uniref:hypothetical protein n=1 Tax=Streptomyces sp. BV286 TaxID=2849672 RepID=UPI001C2ECF2C|nr:hypothetical protein [Streptomyces sp. BV286]MBV1940414.1 hypothetical protein [Streptomyces sp. BV286]
MDRKDGRLRLDVEIPPNTTVDVLVATGGSAAQVDGYSEQFRGVRDDRAIYAVASGRHTFTARETERKAL